MTGPTNPTALTALSSSLSLAQPFPDPIPGIIPFGSLVLLVGPPKCGKTALLASWMARWRDGLTICGKPTNSPTALGIITTDHKWALNQGIWFARAGFPEIPHVSLRDDPTLQWRSTLRSVHGAHQLLDRSLRTLDLSPGGLVLIDVAGVFISNRLNDYNDVLAGMGAMSQTLDKYQLTGVCVGHMGKQRADPKERYLRPHERILGSGAQIGFSDTTMYLLGPQDTGQPYHTFGWLPTHAPEGEFHLQQTDQGLFEPYTGQLAPSPKLDPILEAVVLAFPEPPETLTAIELIALIMSYARIEGETRAKERITDLLLSGRIIRAARGHYMRATIQ